MLHNITILDFETTGFANPGERAIEVAAVKVLNGEIVSQFQTIIHQQKKLLPKIVELTGIQQREVDGGMPEKTAFAILNNLCAGTMLVAHNMAFDAWFYNDALQRIGGRELDAPLLCTLSIARSIMPGHAKNGLGEICKRLELELVGAHRALNDVMATFKLLQLLDTRDGFNIHDHVNQIGYLQRFGVPKWLPKNCVAYAQ